MSDRASIRPFLRLVVACAIFANVATAVVVQGEREFRFSGVAVVHDRDRLVLTDEIGAYGAAVERLHAQTLDDARP